MIWLDGKTKQTFIELRLYAPKNEKILLDFNPLKESKEPDWNPMPYEWSCYSEPLRIYKQDYEILLGYFRKIYPTKDAFDGHIEQYFDVCFDNWIGKEDWLIIIDAIRENIGSHPENEKIFLNSFVKWLEKALQYTNIIVVEGNQ